MVAAVPSGEHMEKPLAASWIALTLKMEGVVVAHCDLIEWKIQDFQEMGAPLDPLDP